MKKRYIASVSNPYLICWYLSTPFLFSLYLSTPNNLLKSSQISQLSSYHTLTNTHYLDTHLQKVIKKDTAFRYTQTDSHTCTFSHKRFTPRMLHLITNILFIYSKLGPYMLSLLSTITPLTFPKLIYFSFFLPFSNFPLHVICNMG